MYVVTVRFTVAAEHAGAFADTVAEQARNSLEREADCRVFDVCRDPEDASSFFLYEKYMSRDAFDEHLRSAHFLEFDAKVTPWVTGKTVKCWDELEPRP